MQPPGALVRSRQHLSLDDFDYGYFDYDRPRQRITDNFTGLLTPDSFTVLPPLPPPTPSPPPAPRAYRIGSPSRRQRKASFVILTSPQPQLPGSASSTRHPSPTEPRKLPPGKSRIPRSQPVSREASPARKRSLIQQRRASVSPIKPASPKNARKASIKKPVQKSDLLAKTSVTSKDAHSSPSRIPRPPAGRGRKSSREQSPTRKNSRGPPQKKGPSPAVSRNQQPVFRKNSNLKPVAGKPPLPPGTKTKTGADTNKTNTNNVKAGHNTSTNSGKDRTKSISKPGDNNNKPATKQDVATAKADIKSEPENSKTINSTTSESSKSITKPESESSKESASSNKSQDTCVYVNPTMASAPATTSAPATSSPSDPANTSTTIATTAPATSSTTSPTPDTSSTLVSTTTAPSLELAKPSGDAVQQETSEQTKSSSASTKASTTSDGSAAVATTSMESVRSTDTVATVRAASSPHPKKKTEGEGVTTSETVIKGDPDLESLSPNTPQPQQKNLSEGLPVAATSSKVEEAASASEAATTQSSRTALLSRLCPCCQKFSSKLNCLDKLNCLKSKSLTGSKVGILGTSKGSQEAGSSSMPPGRKCEWLRMIFCCSRRGGKFCSCCKKKADLEAADASRRRSNATSRMSKKQSRSSSTAIEPDTRPKLDPSLVEGSSMMKGALPVLPVPLAWICLIFNIIVPGLGTLSSGFFCLCFGKPRFTPHDDPQGRLGSFVVNIIVAVAQLFTVVFCLVGWGWSIWWGFIMLRIAKKHRKLKAAEAATQPNLTAPVTQQNHDVERGN